MLSRIVNFAVASIQKLSTSPRLLVHDRAVGHITVAELELSHGDVTSRPIMDNF
jgi:hypothetical protein